MGKKKGQKKRKAKPVNWEATHAEILSRCPRACVAASCQGCHFWHGSSTRPPWMLGKPEPFNSDDFGLEAGDEVPDLSVDPETMVLTVINAKPTPRCFHVTIEHPATGFDGAQLQMGAAKREDGDDGIACVTLVLLIPPLTMAEVCAIEVEDGSPGSVRLSSDCLDWEPHSDPNSTALLVLERFPLAGDGPWLCSQGAGGGLTHFSHPSTYHAIDLECRVGTPVVAVGDGVITDVRDRCCASGIHVKNLFTWNSITLHLDAPQEAPVEEGGAEGAAEEEKEEEEWEDVDDANGGGVDADDGGVKARGPLVEYVHIQVRDTAPHPL